MLKKSKYKYKGLTLAVNILFYALAPELAAAKKEVSQASFAQKIEALALEEIKNTGIPSLQISIGLGKDVIYDDAFGFADIENQVKATPKSKYRTASIAKWFTATLAMRLQEAGMLDLDKPVQTYCSEFPQKQEGPISSRQLLTHTSGIRHYLDYKTLIEAAGTRQLKSELEKKMLREELSLYTRYTEVVSPLDIFKEDPLVFAPGTGWEYSSFGYRLLACVLQGAGNTEYVELMKEMIFKPAHMRNTLPDDAWAIIPNRTTGYGLDQNGLRRADLRDVSENLPAGGYLSNASDLVKFALAFNKGLISDEKKQLMSSPVSEILDTDSDPSWRDAMPQQDKYGYGLMLFTKYVDGMIGHTGRQAGASSIVVLVPEKSLAIAVMTNVKGWNGHLNFTMRIHELVEGK